jgi:DNA-binding transcriptional LysR family regulator
MLNLRQLHYFLAMAEAGSMSDAAARLGVSQPTLSTALRDLEASLGIVLFGRSRGRSLILTTDGTALLPEARAMLQHAEEFEQRAVHLTSASGTTLRVGALVTVAPIELPPLLRAYRNDHPATPITLTTGDQAEMLQALAAGDIDVALTYDLQLDDSFDFRAAVEVPPMALLAADHPLAHRRRVTLRALAGDPFVLLDLPLSRDYFTAVFLSAGQPMRPTMRTTDAFLLRSLVAAGFGYSVVNLVPSGSVTAGGGEVRHVPFADDLPTLRLGVARRRVPTTSPALSAESDRFVDFTVAWLQRRHRVRRQAR